MTLQVKGFFDTVTNTVSYVAWDPATKSAAIIDPVLDYSPNSGRTSKKSADVVIAHMRENGLSLEWILETHVHADHLSAAPYVRQQLGGKLGIGKNVVEVQKVFGKVFNAGPDFPDDGRQFDHLFDDMEVFSIGDIEARALHTPGHTPACMTFVVGDAAFVGDTLFMPDFGTARCDFPGGDAHQLYRSIQKIFALPDETRLFICHDYKAPGRNQFAWETTVGEERSKNVHVGHGKSEEEFVALRQARDASLDMPTLILPSVQVNMRAGKFPPAEEDGVKYLKIPLDTL